MKRDKKILVKKYMLRIKVKVRYVNRQCFSHYFELVSAFCKRDFVKDLISAKYPSLDVFVNTANKFHLK